LVWPVNLVFVAFYWMQLGRSYLLICIGLDIGSDLLHNCATKTRHYSPEKCSLMRHTFSNLT
jgi:hypothetical protein